MTNFLVIDASLMIKLLLPNDQQTHIQQLMADWHQAQYHFYAPGSGLQTAPLISKHDGRGCKLGC